MRRCKCCKQPIPEKPRVQAVTVEGISYKRLHWPDGSLTVETPCQCFGSYHRMHSTIACPWMKKRFGSYPWAAAKRRAEKAAKGE